MIIVWSHYCQNKTSSVKNTDKKRDDPSGAILTMQFVQRNLTLCSVVSLKEEYLKYNHEKRFVWLFCTQDEITIIHTIRINR